MGTLFPASLSVQVQLPLKIPHSCYRIKGLRASLTSLDSAIPEEASNGLHTCHIDWELVLVIPSTSNCDSQRFLWLLFYCNCLLMTYISLRQILQSNDSTKCSFINAFNRSPALEDNNICLLHAEHSSNIAGGQSQLPMSLLWVGIQSSISKVKPQCCPHDPKSICCREILPLRRGILH